MKKNLRIWHFSLYEFVLNISCLEDEHVAQYMTSGINRLQGNMNTNTNSTYILNMRSCICSIHKQDTSSSSSLFSRILGGYL
jgi:hypothetical protein